jgi:hypothetical protein
MPLSIRASACLASFLVSFGFAACHRDDVREAVINDGPETVSFDVAAPDGSTSNYPRDFGNPCNENSDCLGGFCVEGVDGAVCTTVCVEDCPAGWQCRGVASGSSDVAFVCVPGGAEPSDVASGQDGSTSGPDGGNTDSSGSDTTTTRDGSGPEPEGELCGLALGPAGETVLAEDPANDFPDCVVGCGRSAADFTTAVDLARDPYTAVSGVIDAGSHLYEGNPGPDTDIIAISAPPRTMIELAVQRANDRSVMDPLIYVTDGFAIRTFNRDLSSSNDCARSTIAFPYLSDLPIYVVIEHTLNADVWTPAGYPPGSWVGGEDFQWLLRVRARPFEFIDLGALTTPGASLSARSEVLERAGLTRYYRFRAPGDAVVRVDLSESAGAPTAFVPMIAGMKTMLGALEWQTMNHDGDDDGRVGLQRSAFRPCVPEAECFGGQCNGPRCTSELVEYVFAVGDWGGEGGSAFRYDLDLRMD